jgi:hypothetical protein
MNNLSTFTITYTTSGNEIYNYVSKMGNHLLFNTKTRSYYVIVMYKDGSDCLFSREEFQKKYEEVKGEE